MSGFLDLIIKGTEVAEATIELPEPEGEIKSDEEVIGEVVNPRLKRLYHLHNQMAKEATAVVYKSIVELSPHLIDGTPSLQHAHSPHAVSQYDVACYQLSN